MPVTECDKTSTQNGRFPAVEGMLTRTAALFNWFAVGALLLMFAIMVVDILSSKILNRPITATVDAASFLAIIVASFSVSHTILAGRHIEVEFIAVLLPRGVRKTFNVIASLLSLGFFSFIVWRSVAYANSLLKTGESSLTQHIPMAPFAYAIAVACIPAVLIYAYQTYRDTKEVR